MVSTVQNFTVESILLQISRSVAPKSEKRSYLQSDDSARPESSSTAFVDNWCHFEPQIGDSGLLLGRFYIKKITSDRTSGRDIHIYKIFDVFS